LHREAAPAPLAIPHGPGSRSIASIVSTPHRRAARIPQVPDHQAHDRKGRTPGEERDASTIALPLTRSKRLTALILVDDMSSMLTTACLHAGDTSHPR